MLLKCMRDVYIIKWNNILTIYSLNISAVRSITIIEKKHESIDKGDAFRSLLTDLYIVAVFNTSY